MNGIDNIIARIEADEKKALASLAAEHEKKLSDIRKADEEYAEALMNDAVKKADEDEKDTEARAITRAKTQSRDMLLGAKSAQADKVFALAVEAFETMNKASYDGIMARLLENAYSDGEIARRAAVLTVAEKRGTDFADTAFEALAKNKKEFVKPTVIKDASLTAGFRLESEEIELDCTPKRLIDASAERLSSSVISILFPAVD